MTERVAEGQKTNSILRDDAKVGNQNVLRGS